MEKYNFDEKLKNIDSLNYEAKQMLIKNIKQIYNIKFGYVDKFNNIIDCKTYDCLKSNLAIGGEFGFGTKLVIQ